MKLCGFLIYSTDNFQVRRLFGVAIIQFKISYSNKLTHLQNSFNYSKYDFQFHKIFCVYTTSIQQHCRCVTRCFLHSIINNKINTFYMTVKCYLYFSFFRLYVIIFQLSVRQLCCLFVVHSKALRKLFSHFILVRDLERSSRENIFVC